MEGVESFQKVWRGISLIQDWLVQKFISEELRKVDKLIKRINVKDENSYLKERIDETRVNIIKKKLRETESHFDWEIKNYWLLISK